MHYWTSHHPYIVPQPFTLEPTESYSMAELDEYAAVLAEVAREAREDPEVVRTAPHNRPCTTRTTTTWRTRGVGGDVAGLSAEARVSGVLTDATPVADFRAGIANNQSGPGS